MNGTPLRSLHLSAILSLCALICASSTALAAEGAASTQPTTRTQLTLHADLIARYNPAGVMLLAGGLARRVFSADPVLGPTSYLQAGLVAGANPAYAQGTAYVEWMAAPFAILRAQYDLFGFFGANGALLSFPTGDVPFGDDQLDALGGAEQPGTGHRLMVQPTLRAKFGPVILRNQTDLATYRFSGEGPYFFEWEYDTLLENGDLLVANRFAVPLQLWSSGREAMLLAGPYHEVVHARGSGLTRQRLGVLLYLVPADAWGAVARPRLFAQAGVNLVDANRRHQAFLVVGAGSDFDL